MVKSIELSSIELASFTTITTGIAVLFSIIAAVLISIFLAVGSPAASGIIIYLIPTIIVATLMYTIYNAFFEGFLYNLLAKKLKKPIQFLISEDNEIIRISTTETAIISSVILTIQVILIYLVSGIILPLLLSTAMQTLMYSGQQLMAMNVYQFLVLISQPTTIAIMIFGTFIISFVFVLVGTYIYNILGERGRGVVVNFADENGKDPFEVIKEKNSAQTGYTSIESVDSLKLAIVFAIISAILSLVSAIMMIIMGVPISTAIGSILGGFVGGFIEAYLIGVFYNFLAPKLGKLKLSLVNCLWEN